MDQNALLLLLVGAIINATPISQHNARFLRPPISFCWTVNEAKPQLTDIKLANPWKLSSADQDMLRPLAAFMRQHNCGVRIEGYSDESGSIASRKQAAQARAKTVMDYLTKSLPESQRVRLDQVEAEGKGELTTPGMSREQKKIARIIL